MEIIWFRYAIHSIWKNYIKSIDLTENIANLIGLDVCNILIIYSVNQLVTFLFE